MNYIVHAAVQEIIPWVFEEQILVDHALIKKFWSQATVVALTRMVESMFTWSKRNFIFSPMNIGAVVGSKEAVIRLELLLETCDDWFAAVNDESLELRLEEPDPDLDSPDA